MATTTETTLIRCPSCGATNRVAQEKLEHGLAPVCGKCKTPLAADATLLNITDSTFVADVERSPLPVLLDVWAPWCPPCRQLSPIIDELASEWAGRVRFGKLNLDENQATAARFKIQSIPTLLLFNGGREIDRIVGLYPKNVIAQRLERTVGQQG